ncbi:MAG TPA: hypothetical protein ENJ32_00175 [Crenotrichaceae bacterium]|nr:hypothetical protein [Crenotrichaceae bacterium]
MKKILILGHGYIGRALSARFPDSVYTSSSQEKAKLNSAIYFNLNDSDSWKNIPTDHTVIWTFPAAPLKRVKLFYLSRLQHSKNLLVYASSSCYEVLADDNLVTEHNPLDCSKPRVAGEEYLRQHNAAILVLSGIYGPQREPANWLRKGLIHAYDKTVNLIHRDDIIEITSYLLEHHLAPNGERVNISDGVGVRWSEIAAYYGISTSQGSMPDGTNGKIVSNSKLRKRLPDDFRFRSLFDAERPKSKSNQQNRPFNYSEK